MAAGDAEPGASNYNVEPANRRTDTGASTDLPVLKNKLKEYHIFAIGLSGIIGAGAFIDIGNSLQVSGPIATLAAYGIVGIVAIAVMECIAEMVGTWPIANPFVVFVETFIDEDLGFVVGIAYWYTYAMGFQTLLVATANLMDFWGMSSSLKGLILFVACPVTLVAINLCGVIYFAQIELAASVLKIAFVVITFILMICVNAGALGNSVRIGSTYIDDGWQYNPAVARNVLTGLSESLVIAAFAFIGVELTAITAFESESKTQLRRPVKFIAWITTFTYIVSVASQVSNVKWCSQRLPKLWDQRKVPSGWSCQGELQARDAVSPINKTTSGDSSVRGYGISVAVIALSEAGAPKAAAFVNGLLIFAVISAANTALYVASRSLFGQTRKLKPDPGTVRPFFERPDSIKSRTKWFFVALGTHIEYRLKWFFSTFGTIHPKTKVPAWALVGSWLVFAWIPFIELSAGRTLLDVQEILSTLGSVACVLVWASQCMAFLFYYYWTLKYRNDLSAGDDTARIDRWHDHGKEQIRTWLSFMQPLPAWFGLCACLVIAFILTTATWWDGQTSAKRIISVYLFPGVMFALWVVRKVAYRQCGLTNHQWEDDKLFKRLDVLRDAAREHTGQRSERDAPV